MDQEREAREDRKVIRTKWFRYVVSILAVILIVVGTYFAAPAVKKVPENVAAIEKLCNVAAIQNNLIEKLVNQESTTLTGEIKDPELKKLIDQALEEQKRNRAFSNAEIARARRDLRHEGCPDTARVTTSAPTTSSTSTTSTSIPTTTTVDTRID